MPDRNRAFTLAIISGMSVLAFSGADASVATALALADEELVAVTYGMTQIVQNKNNHVIICNRALHGERCIYRIGGCRYFHKGYYYQSPWWTAPLMVMTPTPTSTMTAITEVTCGVENTLPGASTGIAHIIRAIIWISNSGKVRQCRSTY